MALACMLLRETAEWLEIQWGELPGVAEPHEAPYPFSVLATGLPGVSASALIQALRAAPVDLAPERSSDGDMTLSVRPLSGLLRKEAEMVARVGGYPSPELAGWVIQTAFRPEGAAPARSVQRLAGIVSKWPSVYKAVGFPLEDPVAFPQFSEEAAALLEQAAHRVLRGKKPPKPAELARAVIEVDTVGAVVLSQKISQKKEKGILMEKSTHTPKAMVSKIKASLKAIVAIAFVALAIGYAYLWFSEPPSPEPAASSSVTSHCGDCGALCRTAAFDRASRIPDSLIQCSRSESTPGVALAILRSNNGPRIWIVGETMMAPADSNVLNAQGRDLRLGLVQEAQGRWPWLFDVVAPAGIGVLPSGPQAIPQAIPNNPPPVAPVAPTAQAAPQRPDSPWVLFATEEMLVNTFAGADPDALGDARAATQQELDGVLEWVRSLWPTEQPWRHMAWVGPAMPALPPTA